MKSRRFALLSRLLILAVACCAFLAIAVPADAAITSYEKDATGRVNWSRYTNHVKTIGIADGLAWLARQHSCEMARNQKLYHSTNLTSKVSNWTYLGENVGVSWSLWDVHQAFMKSPKHRANVLNTHYREVGIGVCRDKYGNFWITQIFRG